MKIIKKGSGEVWTKLIQCRHVIDAHGFGWDSDLRRCESVLEIDQDDIIYKTWFKYPNFEGEDYCVKCPVCGALTTIDPSVIPAWVKKLAKDKENVAKKVSEKDHDEVN